MADKQLREDVINAMAAVGRTAEKAGLDPWRAIERTFPGTPIEVVADAWGRVNDEATEEWWAQVEATIDGQAIRKAVVAIAGKVEG